MMTSTALPWLPTRALWDQPWTEECPLLDHVPLDLHFDDYFVETNQAWPQSGPAFVGNVVATLYPEHSNASGTGLYPYFDCGGPPYSEQTCTPVAGGSPQLANLSAHLQQWRADIERIFPDPNSTAVVALDWEAWWPLWGSNMPDDNSTHYFVYGEVARRLVREAEPTLPPAQVEARAKQAWEASCAQWLTETMRVAKELRPHAAWGYYNMPGETGEAGAPPGSLDYLWDAVTALFPSIYTMYPDHASNVVYVSNILTEARRVADRHTTDVSRGVAAPPPSPTPIYVYTMVEYEDSSCPPFCPLPPPPQQEKRFLSAEDFETQFDLPAKFGAAGLVLYGGSADGYTAARCATMRNYTRATLLPRLRAIVSERRACADANCSGHGRCVDGDADPDAGGVLRCACAEGWWGEDCSRT